MNTAVARFLIEEPLSTKGMAPESWCCIDCGVNTAPGFSTKAELDATFAAQDRWMNQGVPQTIDDRSEVYTVRETVWARAGMTPWGGCLCIGCLEERIGRRLKPKDFDRDHPFNQMPGTQRLLSRRGR
jgi:hypothetical protein